MSDTDSEAGAVVVPAISTGSSPACIRSLGRRGIPTIAVSENPAPPSSRSKYCSEFQRVPSPWDGIEAYKRALLDLAKRPDVLTIVPLREVDIYVLSKYREEFGEHVSTPWTHFDGLQTVQDRHRLFDVAERAGVSTPSSSLADDWDGWDEVTVVKSRHAILVEDDTPTYPGVRFFESGAKPDLEEVIDSMGHVPLAQEYVPGDGEYGFFALYDHGEPIATFQHRRVRSYNYSGGASVFRKSVDVPELRRAGMGLLDELDWHGLAMVEFKRDPRDGEFKLMEINPRFWGSLALAVTAGVDFPYLYYRLANGEAVPTASRYRMDVGCHVLHGEVSYLYSVLFDDYDHTERPRVLTALYTIARSLVSDPNFDYFSTDDPEPFVAVFTEAVRHALSSTRD